MVADGAGAVPVIDLDPVVAASRTFTAVVVRSLGEVTQRLSVPQLRVLVVLSQERRLNMRGVAELLGVNASNASRACTSLVRDGLVTRRTDPHDRRNVSLALTREGRRLVEANLAFRKELLGLVVGQMSASDQRSLRAALVSFNAAASRVSDEPQPDRPVDARTQSLLGTERLYLR